jgi:hypothetical protein
VPRIRFARQLWRHAQCVPLHQARRVVVRAQLAQQVLEPGLAFFAPRSLAAHAYSLKS